MSTRQVINYVLNMVYPLKCEICGVYLPYNSQTRLCEKCYSKIVFVKPSFCQTCGRLLNSEIQFCKNCHQPQHKIYFDKIRATCIYDGVLKETLHLIKYKKRIALAKTLANLLCQKAKDLFDFTCYDFIVPVPLYKKQYYRREYNQAEILASALRQEFDLPLLKNSLIRIRSTRPQYELTKEERRKNLKDAFRVKKPEVFKNKNILLIDDIITTGATINECAKILKNCQAQEVCGLVLACGR